MLTAKSEIKPSQRKKLETKNELSTKLPGIKHTNNTKKIDEETA